MNQKNQYFKFYLPLKNNNNLNYIFLFIKSITSIHNNYGEDALEILNVTKYFDKLIVFKNLNLKVKHGEM